MASSVQAEADGPRAVSLREARVRLSQLVALAELNDTVTLITRDGDARPIAAIVPEAAARSLAETRAARQRAEASAAGWERRLDRARADSAQRHRAELHMIRRALVEAWSALDRHVRPGADPGLDALRVAHAEVLRGAASGER
jgi:antitoxin (DNA-binding transcriptional repressor) of toxin-antitoxin stability system